MQPKWVIETVECSTENSMKKIQSSTRYNHELNQLMAAFQTLTPGDAAGDSERDQAGGASNQQRRSKKAAEVTIGDIREKYISNEFLGHLAGKSVEVKKCKVLEIYRYLHRISMEKVKQYSDSPVSILLMLYYIKESKLERFYEREALSKEVDAYYRGVENILNNSRLTQTLLGSPKGLNLLRSLIPEKFY